MRERDVIPFFFMTFAIAWGVLGLFIFAPAAMGKVFGNLTGSHPLFYLAVYAPAISAVIMIIYRQGFSGVFRFLSRLLMWRSTCIWYLLLLVGMPLVFYLSALLKEGAYAGGLFPFASVQAYGLALLLMAVKGPVEEIGWRGFALPLLQRRMSPLYAALLLGFIWAFWHFPAFMLSGTPQSAWSITPFFIGTIALSVIVTPLFNQSGGSILLAGIFHLQAINPLWPDAQPYDTWFFAGLAVVIVWFNRRTMLSRDDAVTEVVPE